MRSDLALLRAIILRPMVVAMLGGWSALGSYDLFLAQLASNATQRDLPRLHDLGWPWWAWITAFSVMLLGFVVHGAGREITVTRARLAEREQRVRLTARLGSLAANVPDPGPDKVSLSVRVLWELWVDRDVSTEKLGLNLIYVYDKRWWQFWKQSRFPRTGIPPQGQETTQYRKRIAAADEQPFRDEAVFEYVADREESSEPHWLLELVLITGMPSGEYRVPVFINWDELHNRGTNPPL